MPANKALNLCSFQAKSLNIHPWFLIKYKLEIYFSSGDFSYNYNFFE